MKRQEKTKGKSHSRQCFWDKLRGEHLKTPYFVKYLTFFFLKDARNLANQPNLQHRNTESIYNSLIELLFYVMRIVGYLRLLKK